MFVTEKVWMGYAPKFTYRNPNLACFLMRYTKADILKNKRF